MWPAGAQNPTGTANGSKRLHEPQRVPIWSDQVLMACVIGFDVKATAPAAYLCEFL